MMMMMTIRVLRIREERTPDREMIEQTGHIQEGLELRVSRCGSG